MTPSPSNTTFKDHRLKARIPEPQQKGSQSVRPKSLDASSQQALFQAYIQALHSGQITMPGLSTQSLIAKAQAQANHHRTISDPKRGVTFAGQDQLKKLPIPTLEETCQRYLESVKPFLVMISKRLVN